MSNRYDLNRGTIHRAYAEDIYPTMEPGSVRLVISDGPYFLQKAAWDKGKLDDLPAWYAPHIEAWSRVCMPSASVYLWNTAEGWARLDPVMRAAGWTLKSLIVWDKMNTAGSMAWEKIDHFPETHEVCGHYSRGDAPFKSTFPRSVWSLAIQSWAHERVTNGNRKPGARNQDGATCMVSEAVHPCQKPLTFSDRMIRASSKPGELVLEPFGGTCRVAVACERMPEPEARRYVCIEPDEDGRDYIAAVLPSLRLEFEPEAQDGQRSLFACPAAGDHV
jgi:DNA modification methylase